jgi:hypothetical protein
VENFDKLEMPNTEYQQELQEYSVCQIENWLRDFTYDNQNREDIELKAESILEKFNEWKVENGVEYNCNSLKFMVRMARLNIPGIGKRKTSGKMMTKFNIVEMKKYFKIGCLL